jgi:transposase
MSTKKELKLLTELLNIEGVNIYSYRQHEGIGIILRIEQSKKESICGRCGTRSNKLHQNHRQIIKDLPWGEKAVFLEINRRQFKCEKCHQPFSEEMEFVKARRTYTKRLAVKILEEVLENDIHSVAKKGVVTTEEIERMLKDAAANLLKSKPVGLKRLGIDEIALIKGQGNYCAVLVDLERSKLLIILESRTKEEIKKVLLEWGVEVLEGIEEVSIDLWKGYKSLVTEIMPKAQVADATTRRFPPHVLHQAVADRFHVMVQVNKELDMQRKKEKRRIEQKIKQAKTEEEKLESIGILAGITASKYALLKNEKDLSQEQKDKLVEVKGVSENLKVMHQLKEKFREIFEKPQQWAEALLDLGEWLSTAQKYFVNSQSTIVRWLDEILAYFDNRTTSGVVEGINNKLKLIKRSAYGFTNFENFRNRCLLSWHFNY